MKKIIFGLLLFVSVTAYARTTTTTLGYLKGTSGSEVSLSVGKSPKYRAILLTVRGEHRIRKASIFLNDRKVDKLIKLLREAQDEYRRK